VFYYLTFDCYGKKLGINKRTEDKLPLSLWQGRNIILESRWYSKASYLIMTWKQKREKEGGALSLSQTCPNDVTFQ
jgi:hypothetical protein